MKESVAIAKEADGKKDFSPAANRIQHARTEPEKQLGSLRSVINNIRHSGGTPSIDSIATELSSMPATALRAPALLALQRTHGNRYVQRVVAGIQAKLKVGQPGDIYEQEADRVADTVMRMPEPEVQRQAREEKEKLLTQAKTITPIQAITLQRQDDEVEEELKKKKKEEEEEETLLTKELPGHVPNVTSGLESRIHGLKGGGQPLPESIRNYYEPRFGYDFGQVRIHTNHSVTETARALKARAFTVGQDIVFDSGQYSPWSADGRKLLAHELTHTIQQLKNGSK